MSGRSLLSSEIVTSKLESENHDQQTLDIRDLETTVAILDPSSSFYRGSSLPTTGLFIGREFFVTTANKSYRLKTTTPVLWVVIEDIAKTITNKEYVDTLQATLQGNIDSKLSAGSVTALGNSILAASSASEVRTLISAAKSGLITASTLTQNTNKFIGRLTAGTGALEELSSAIPFIPANSLTKDLISNTTTTKFKKLWKTTRGVNNYRGCMALTDQNTLIVWGRTGDSKLGIRSVGDIAVGLTTPKFTPKIPLGEYVVDFQSTGQNSFVVLSNGWVYSCGTNAYGSLGQADLLTYTFFKRINWFIANGVSISQVENDGSRVTTDATSTFYISTDRHKLYCSGYNGYGQLGIGSTVNAQSPTLSKDLGSDTIKKVATGGGYTTAAYLLTDSGVLYSTGFNTSGQCGDGTVVNRTTWFQMATGVDDFDCTAGFTSAAAAGGAGHILVHKTDGTLWACGYNGYGQLGMGDTTNRTVLTAIPSASPTTSPIFGTSGGSYGWSYRVGNSGNLGFFGHNGQGHFGQGNTTNLSIPTNVTQSAESSTVSPFTNKVKLVCHNGSSIGHGNMLVLDTDERLWFAGNDYQYYVIDSSAVVNLFTEITYTLEHPDERIIDIKYNGLDGGYAHYFLTNHGKIYGMGESTYGVIDGIGAAIPNPTRGLYRVGRST